jgi:alkylation response protein AidB-like acyl-CoA dehydrogenase
MPMMQDKQFLRSEESILHSNIPDGSDFLSQEELASLTPTELTRRIEELAPQVAARADEAEQIRRPVPEIWSALRRSGFFYQFVPKEFGGIGSSIDSFMDAALPLARARPSTAWNACFCAGHNIYLAHFPEQTQREIWGGDFPYVVAPSLGMPIERAIPCDGGYRVSGRWVWGSGVTEADRLFAMMLSEEAGTKKYGMASIPARQATILDTWHTDGLKGSGSNTVVVEDVFVPGAHFVSDPGLIAGKTSGSQRFRDPIFRTPMISRGGFFAVVPVVGAAQGALEQVRSAWRDRAAASASPQELPTRYFRLGEAHLMIATAETLVRDTGRKMLAAPDLNEQDQIRLRIETRSRFAYAGKLCRDAVALLNGGARATLHRLHVPFQRYLRYINIMASHVGFDEDQAFELAGARCWVCLQIRRYFEVCSHSCLSWHSSRKWGRPDPREQARAAYKYVEGELPAGLVREAGREGESQQQLSSLTPWLPRLGVRAAVRSS